MNIPLNFNRAEQREIPLVVTADVDNHIIPQDLPESEVDAVVDILITQNIHHKKMYAPVRTIVPHIDGDDCPRVREFIECKHCGYPYSEALFSHDDFPYLNED